MWVKVALGASFGLVLGSFLAPGHTTWIVMGVVAGYTAERWALKEKQKRAPKVNV